ncbi:cysteine hydrolase family protein [Saccharopolyspora rosea]|uniref:Cysteine hydrolase family protein n=1 Tax=Saccharopolyspora rosea TaxID=524884 RepID=A0ABW3FYY4_9PSEU|nr:cysteine hydrolase [Saccharopolyspora rosea]
MSATTPTVDPRRTALLVMDYQNGIVGLLPEPAPLLARAADAISTVRGHGGHVGHVRVAFTEADYAAMPETSPMAAALTPERRATMHVDSPATAIHDRIAPAPEDIVVRKTRVGAFSTTDLDQQLRDRGITTLLLAGISTSGVVLSTARDAADRDYRLLVLTDACADPDPEVHAFLTERVLPRQATPITTADLDAVLGGGA